MKATNIPFTDAPISVFVLANVNGVVRLRQSLPINIPSSGSAAAAQATANTAITNAAAAQSTATAAQAAATAAQATANAALPLAGGTMSGVIAMGTNKITGLAAPSAAGDAARKTDVDAARIFRLGIACSDETTALTTGTAKVTFRMPSAVTLTAVRASLTTVSSSGIVTVDINESGSTILSTKLTIDVGEKTSTTAAVPPVISDAALADDAEITIDIDVAGTGATGLKIFLLGTY